VATTFKAGDRVRILTPVPGILPHETRRNDYTGEVGIIEYAENHYEVRHSDGACWSYKHNQLATLGFCGACEQENTSVGDYLCPECRASRIRDRHPASA
jgi:hypothetical protein